MIVLVAAAAAAHAEGVMMTMPNKAGGMVRLTDATHSLCEGRYHHLVHANARDGRASVGCWRYSKSDRSVYIRWSDGEVTIHDVDMFTSTDYMRDTYTPKESM